MSRFKTLFSNPESLEKEADEQGGLMIDETSGERKIVLVPDDRFSAKQLDSVTQTAVEVRP
jgi:hypothetical protein